MSNKRLSLQLSRNECTIMRGLAIIGIVLHNYAHWLGGIVQENEYQYHQDNVDDLLQSVFHAGDLLPFHLLSFFGHYGVPVFLFLSAYGLEMKYGSLHTATTSPGILRFIRYHWLKLFRMMIVGFTVFIIIDRMTPGARSYNVTQIITQLLMVNNWLWQPDKQIWPGPYWFFGLMLQLYVIYRMLMFRKHTAVTVALMAVCTAVQLFLQPDGEPINYYRYNFMGGMLPFGCGILWARYAKGTTSKMIGLALLPLFIWMIWQLSQSVVGWTILPVVICMAAVATAKLVPESTTKALLWIGRLSMAMFIIHPVTRKVFIPISRQGDFYTGLLLYIIATIGTAWLVNMVMEQIQKPQR